MTFQFGFDLNGWLDDEDNRHGTFTFTPSFVDELKPSQKTILSLFDVSGEWSRPYREAGYNVAHIDIQNWLSVDIHDINREWLIDWGLEDVHGILAALPCTDFAGSGARWWDGKDHSGATKESVDLAYQTLAIIEFLRPSWWVLENPVGRLPELVPELEEFGPLYFNPCDYGDPHTKKTGLWGEFNKDMKRTPVEPTEGSKMHNIAPGPERQYLRSITPAGFANAFFAANP
ncbi:MAG: DNA methyltransferase [Sulfitobacter sp.]|nr:MAG: DNA methyltransferase [Sulfitobacter sp.]